jgi:hypothetical protein
MGKVSPPYKCATLMIGWLATKAKNSGSFQLAIIYL